MPAKAPTFRRNRSISNGLVANSRHSPSALKDARLSGGSAQYGSRRISPNGDSPNGARWYQMNPMMAPTTTASTEIMMRRRSSCRCSTKVISPVGFFCLREKRSLPFTLLLAFWGDRGCDCDDISVALSTQRSEHFPTARIAGAYPRAAGVFARRQVRGVYC